MYSNLVEIAEAINAFLINIMNTATWIKLMILSLSDEIGIFSTPFCTQKLLPDVSFEKIEMSKSVYISPDELTLASLIDILKRNLIAVHPHLKFMVIGKVWIMFYFETSWHCLLFWYAT